MDHITNGIAVLAMGLLAALMGLACSNTDSTGIAPVEDSVGGIDAAQPPQDSATMAQDIQADNGDDDIFDAPDTILPEDTGEPDQTPDLLVDTMEEVAETTADSTPQEDQIQSNSGDADEPLAPLDPFVQCQSDLECQAIFGPASMCNTNFPGNQCTNCDPFDDQCSALSSTQTLTCKETYPPVCLFDCPCPEWLKCLGDLCVLKPCSTDEECGPLVCRPLSGASMYCLPPS